MTEALCCIRTKIVQIESNCLAARLWDETNAQWSEKLLETVMGSDNTIRASVVVRGLGNCVLLYSLTDDDWIGATIARQQGIQSHTWLLTIEKWVWVHLSENVSRDLARGF